MTSWFKTRLVDPTAEVLAALAVGDELRELSGLQDLAIGIEGLLRTQLGADYPPWPRESTTDGFEIAMCVKTGEHVLEVTGMGWIDFGGEKFPARAQIELTANHSDVVAVTAQIGEVDPRTGAPPRLRSGSMIIPARDENDENPVPEVLVGHRVRPITWTQAIRYQPDEYTDGAAT